MRGGTDDEQVGLPKARGGPREGYREKLGEYGAGLAAAQPSDNLTPIRQRSRLALTFESCFFHRHFDQCRRRNAQRQDSTLSCRSRAPSPEHSIPARREVV